MICTATSLLRVNKNFPWLKCINIIYLVLLPQELCLMELIFFEECYRGLSYKRREPEWLHMYFNPLVGVGKYKPSKEQLPMGVFNAEQSFFHMFSLNYFFFSLWSVFHVDIFWNVKLNNSWFLNQWFRYSCHFLSWLYSLEGAFGVSSCAEV